MKKETFLELLRDNPVISAVKSPEGLQAGLASDCNIVFLLFGDLFNIDELTRRVKAAGKAPIVHMDLVEGLDSSITAARYLAERTQAEGIISTRQSALKFARENGLLTLQRFFLIDSMAFANMQKQLDLHSSDFIEVLPGVMPKVIRKIVACTRVPLIASGLMTDKEDIIQALQAGAAGVSSTDAGTWFL